MDLRIRNGLQRRSAILPALMLRLVALKRDIDGAVHRRCSARQYAENGIGIGRMIER